MVKKKIENGDSIAKIADDLLEDADVIEKIYDIVKENPEKTREEICEILMNQKNIIRKFLTNKKSTHII